MSQDLRMATSDAEKTAATDLELQATRVLDKIPLGTEMVRLGPRPLFIEFCGTPKSGKTTCSGALTHFLKRNGFGALTLTERAGVCPLRRKTHMSFNVWTACASLTQMLEALDRDHEIVVLDRGIFDALCWFNFMEMIGRLTAAEKAAIFSFLLMDRWRHLIDIVFLMTTTPEEALRREYQYQLTQKEGSIMNIRTLSLFNQAIELTHTTMSKHFKSVISIDTTDLSPANGARKIAVDTLNALDHLLDERIMVVKKAVLGTHTLTPGVIAHSESAADLFNLIQANYFFLERRLAETNTDVVQIIPAAIVQHDGKVLLLRRKERDARDRLHNKYSIWAGGHAREQDGAASKDIHRCGSGT